jgi:hypothetical protein
MTDLSRRLFISIGLAFPIIAALSCGNLPQRTEDLSGQIAATLLSLTQTAASVPTQAPPPGPTPEPTSAATQEPTAPPTPEIPWKPCEDAPESQLHVGDLAYVGYEPPECNRVRQDPDKNTGEILGTICPGEEVRILDGPVCNNNWVWWRVEQLDGDLEGWSVEGDEDNYWLIRTDGP